MPRFNRIRAVGGRARHGVASWSGVFNPISLSPSIWCDASNTGSLFQNTAGTTSATADGDPIGRWNDLTVNANNMTQGTGTKRPTLKANAKNGKNTVLFDGVDDFLAGAVVASTSYTLFVVYKNPTTNSVLVSNGVTNTNGFAVIRNVSDQRRLLYGGSNVLDDGSATANFEIMSAKKLSGTSTLRINGSGVSLTNSSSALVLPATSITLGAATGGGSNAANCEIGEFIFFNSGLTLAQEQQVEAYLNSKWAVY